MTLRVEENGGAREILGSFEGITRPERLFLRSIGQFYVRRDTVSPLTGHAIFIDRLAFPEFDGKAERLEINNTKLGIVEPFFYLSSDTPNMGQLYDILSIKDPNEEPFCRSNRIPGILFTRLIREQINEE